MSINASYILKTDNANYAVDLSDLKAYLKIEHTSDDVLLQALTKTATLIVEKYISRELLTKTFNLYLDYFCNNYKIAKSKLQNIVSFSYYYNDNLEVLDNTLYDFTEESNYSRIYLVNNTSFSADDRRQAINIEFEAGYGATNASIPQSLKDSIKIIIAYMYSNRGDCSETMKIIEQSGAIAILDMYKIIEI